MRTRKNIFESIDRLTVALYFFLVITGWVSIYASAYTGEAGSIMDTTRNYGKQMIWIASSIFLILCILLIDLKFYTTFSYLIYFLVLMSLMAVIFTGREIAGSRSWFQIGGFSLQPSEFAKFATCLALAKYLSNISLNVRKLYPRVIAAGIIALPSGLIFLQHDTGSAIVFLALILVLFREGLSGKLLVIGGFTGLFFVLTLIFGKFTILGALGALGAIYLYLHQKKIKTHWFRYAVIFLVASSYIFSVDYAFEHFLEPHQKKRINVLIGKETDLRGAGYNVHQSKIAIGSGGFAGKGFLKGTQTKFNFVPEQSTDFIFCTVGEEWGFLGSFLLIVCFVGLTIRLVIMAERQRSKFAMLYGYGVAAIIFFHFAVNIGMTIGLLPVVGIPLPFLSYGGSSLWGFTILLFIFVKMDSARLELL
ncbi:MAG: rod shape-determining protein RodA [Bacteroidales bacterium]|nr:rod shape-determining protein RodA [Bacteroidales bacterium]